MRRRPSRSRKTDYGTIILHWLLVAALVVAIATGLSIGAEAPDRTWINVLAQMLPSSAAWTAHRQSAIALVAVSVAYAVYVSSARLGRRIRLDRVRLLGLLGRSQARWAAINIILYWMFFVTMSTELITGGLLYYGYGNSILLDVHWIGMWVLLGYPALHVLVHWRLGGTPQLLRVFHPSSLIIAPPPVDLVELVAQLAEATRQPLAQAREAEEAESDREHRLPSSDDFKTSGRDRISNVATRAPVAALPDEPHKSGTVLQANPLVVSMAAASSEWRS